MGQRSSNAVWPVVLITRMDQRSVIGMTRRGPHRANITWNPHYRVAWGGTLGGQGEIWTNSLKYVPGDNSVITVQQAAAAAPGVWEALRTFLEPGLATDRYITAQAVMTWLKINQVNSDGLQPGATNFYAGTAAPGMGTGNVPLYQTVAISLRTGLARGRAHIGRIFPPCVSVTDLDVNGRLSVGDSTSLASQFALCLVSMQTAIRTATSTASGFAVVSPGNTLKGTTPTFELITSVEVDTVPDVQHRRTNKLKRAIGTSAPVAG